MFKLKTSWWNLPSFNQDKVRLHNCIIMFHSALLELLLYFPFFSNLRKQNLKAKEFALIVTILFHSFVKILPQHLNANNKYNTT